MSTVSLRKISAEDNYYFLYLEMLGESKYGEISFKETKLNAINIYWASLEIILM